MRDVTIYAPAIVKMGEWISDQCEHLSTKEVHICFKNAEVTLYDYEDGIGRSKRPLAYFMGD